MVLCVGLLCLKKSLRSNEIYIYEYEESYLWIFSLFKESLIYDINIQKLNIENERGKEKEKRWIYYYLRFRALFDCILSLDEHIPESLLKRICKIILFCVLFKKMETYRFKFY